MSEQFTASCRSEEPVGAVGEGVELPGGDGGQGGDALEARLRRLVAAHLDVDPRRLVPAARLGQDLCVDSLAAIELTMVIEDEFDIALPEEVVADVRTYGDVLTLVAERAGDHAN